MKPLKLILLFFALVAIQIATAEWLHVPPPVEARGLMMVGGGVPVVGVANGVIGLTNTGGSTVVTSVQYISFSEQTTTTAGSVRYGHVYVADSDGETWRVALYNTSGEELICCTGTRADGSAGWINCDAGESYTIVDATAYWLAHQGSGTAESASTGQREQYDTSWTSGYADCPNALTISSGFTDYGNGYPTVIWNNVAGDP